jgi:pyrroloquinoline quinone (PQQ) biosynthesis protein C
MNTLTKEEIEARINVLSDEMAANDEENRAMQEEIDGLYKQLDSMKDC